MTINDNSTKSINAAIIDLQNQIKQLQHKIGILSKNQLKEDDIEFPGKVEYADEAGKAKEADHAKTADTAKYTSETENAVHAGYADIATKATQDGSGNVITDTYATKTELTSGLSGKANTSHNHSAADITSGTLAVERGGTGATTALGAFENLANGLPEGAGPLDTEHIIFQNENRKNWGLYTLSQFWEYIKGKISSVLGLTKDNYGGKANTAGTADKSIEVVDYGDTSRTVKVGYFGSSLAANNLLYLAGYTEATDSSVKLKDVSKAEVIKWLGIPIIKYADYQTPTQTFTQFQQVPIQLSNFSSEVTPDNVLCFMVIYWSGVQLIASADWGSTASSGLKCALTALQAGTGLAIVRCVYMV